MSAQMLPRKGVVVNIVAAKADTKSRPERVSLYDFDAAVDVSLHPCMTILVELNRRLSFTRYKLIGALPRQRYYSHRSYCIRSLPDEGLDDNLLLAPTQI